jgi:4-phytase/acid phosphatase
MARRISGILAAKDAPAVNVFVGHDNNIAALASLIGAHFKMDGYGQDDPPIGGALELQVFVDGQGRRFVGAFYEAQTPDQLRSLAPLSLASPPVRRELELACHAPGQRLCRLEDFLVDAGTTCIGFVLAAIADWAMTRFRANSALTSQGPAE